MIINSDKIYEKLREHLDNLPVGFSKTESGVEIDILKKIFEPEEAEFAIHLKPEPEPFEDFCKRTNISMSRAAHMLDKMSKKGQIFRMHRKGKTHYSAAVYLPGIWEYQLKNLDGELVVKINREQCIGCGLCVSVCPEDALQLIRKSDEELSELPITAGSILHGWSVERGLNE